MADEEEVASVESAQELEIGITGPKNSDRLFVYTGLAHVDHNGFSGDPIVNFTMFINLSKLHNGRKFDANQTLTAPVAYLANIHGNDDATDFTWAVTKAQTRID